MFAFTARPRGRTRCCINKHLFIYARDGIEARTVDGLLLAWPPSGFEVLAKVASGLFSQLLLSLSAGDVLRSPTSASI